MGSRAYIQQAVAKSRQGWSSDIGVIGIPTTRRIVLCTTRFTIQKFYALSTEHTYLRVLYSSQNKEWSFSYDVHKPMHRDTSMKITNMMHYID